MLHSAMTLTQINVFNLLYAILYVAVAILTRAMPRRIAGSIVGGIAMAIAGIGIVAYCQAAGWWRFVIPSDPYFQALLFLDFALGGFTFLLTWRVARRYGARGLALCVVIAAALGPVRDSSYMAFFPEWGSYAPGPMPMIAISAAYVILGVIGHGVMRLVAGPASADPLARRLW